ncbi:MAG: FAD-binding protein, partial [Beijerinckiaceae bacterium]
ATIGGMGLTGLVTWVEIELMKTGSPHVAQTATRFANLREYFAVHAESDADFEYSVAWIDSLASGAHLGRGVSMLGNHARPEDLPPPAPGDAMRAARIGVPFRLPFAAVSGPALRAFNAAYFRKPLGRAGATVDYKSFFYPLDGVNGWNRLYGPRGLRQFQCVVPEANAEAAIGDMLRLAQHAGQGSFLTVLKKFGVTLSPGLLSFPRPGFTLTLDFPYRGPVTDRLLGDLDAIALAAGGGVNPYKDARMSREVFEASFPRWRQMQAAIDPLAQSQFSQRIGLTGVAHPAIYAAA